MLINETETRDGRPDGLQLAYATPRGWLRPGQKIAVQRAPTSFGPISYSLSARRGEVDVTIDTPKQTPPRALHLRLRLPRGNQIIGVALNGQPYPRVDSRSGTIDLSGQTGPLSLTVHTSH
jgi:hypothetical protein